ncbi:MAG TPA: N-acetylmuramidase family protein [Allosphingosinicella sp.]|jgi:hypothetical protein|nr:N-acetylmuramidase family protein [Allosphingosinicella sp.]
MPFYRKQLMDVIRPELKGPVTAGFVARLDAVLDQCGVPRDGAESPKVLVIPDVPAAPASPPRTGKLDVAALRMRLGLPPEGGFDAAARSALLARLSNKAAPPLAEADFQRVAAELGVSPKLIMAVRKVEAPRGPFDDAGRPSILYEKHVFSRATGHRFDKSHPVLSAPTWQPGTYGPFSAQYGKLADACALDPDAAFKACSWGAFQVLGENAEALGYASAFDMALALTKSEAAHLECFIRFVRSKKLIDALRAAKPGNPESCIPFVKAYNGPGYAANEYHVKLAQAAL